MRYGAVLPLARPYAAEEPDKIEQALALGYSAFWLQEWPVGSGPSESLDHGSGHDPVVYASHLARQYGSRGVSIGLAVLRADYRQPYVAARALVSAQHLGGGYPLLVGLGMETATPEAFDRLVQTWHILYACLHEQRSDVFLLPSTYVPPKMYLASGKFDLWEATEFKADGLLTTRIDPRQIAPISNPLRERIPHLEIIVQIFWRIDVADRALCREVGGVLQIGKDRVRELAHLWKEAGVTGCISYFAETPSEAQLSIVAEALKEVG